MKCDTQRRWCAGLTALCCALAALVGSSVSTSARASAQPATAPAAPPAPTTSAPAPSPAPAAAPSASPQGKPQSKNPATKPDWWRDAVFYQIFVRSFNDSRTGPKANDGTGDIQGIIDRLDYLNDGDPNTTTDLGITAIWLLPISPSPSYHGYDIKDYRDINPDYGSLDDFKRLLDECHKRGIAVIIDMVFNHCSDEHPAFLDAQKPGSTKRDWFIWSETNPGWKGPWGQTVWQRLKNPQAGGAGPYYYGLFSNRMPDLNYRNDEVSREMLDVTKFWFKDIGVDGFRLDAIKFLVENGQKVEDQPETNAWLKLFRQRYKSFNPNGYTVGEVWSGDDKIVPFLNDQLDACFAFDLSFSIIASVNEGKAQRVREAAARMARLYRPGQAATFITNHDQNRTMSEFAGDQAKARLAATILLTLPGTPFIYYGEEIGMTGKKPDEKIRTPMHWTSGVNAGFAGAGVRPWQAINPEFTRANVATQSADPKSLLSHYRSLIRLRERHSALSRGDFVEVPASDPRVFAFLRRERAPDGKLGELALVVMNLHNASVGDVTLTLDTGPSGTDGFVRRAREVLRNDKAAAPKPEGDGRELRYKPFDRLDARTAYVVILER